MQKRNLTLSHPVDCLEMYDWAPAKWECFNPPELYLIDDSALVPLASIYMPHVFSIEVDSKGPVETVARGQARHFFKLTGTINPIWLRFYEKYRGDDDVSFAGDTLILSCPGNALDKTIEGIAQRKLHQATADYRAERENLLWCVFDRMQLLAKREELEREILAEFNKYRQARREWEMYAKQHGWSVPVVIDHYHREYKGVLRNKFTYLWEKVLDDATIRHYKAAFEQEFLVI